MLGAFTAILRAFPDNHSESEHTLENGEWVIIEWSFGGTMHGEFAGHAPTGRSFALRGLTWRGATDHRSRVAAQVLAPSRSTSAFILR